MKLKALASSIYDSTMDVDKAIDGIISSISGKNMFHSAMDKHSWFVVDLGNYINVKL